MPAQVIGGDPLGIALRDGHRVSGLEVGSQRYLILALRGDGERRRRQVVLAAYRRDEAGKGTVGRRHLQTHEFADGLDIVDVEADDGRPVGVDELSGGVVGCCAVA